MALALALFAASATADIYKYVDNNGVVHFANQPLGSGYKLVLRGKGKPAVDYTASLQNRRRFSLVIDKIARHFRIDRALVHAVVTAESAYDPNALSPAGALGLMQLMPDTAARYGVRNRADPVQNVYAGVRYLRDLIVQFDSVSLARAAYNAGEQAVIRHGNRIPPYRETRDYVRRVLYYYRKYRAES